MKHTYIALAGALLIATTCGAFAEDPTAPTGSQQNIGGAPSGQGNAVESGRSSGSNRNSYQGSRSDMGSGAKSAAPMSQDTHP